MTECRDMIAVHTYRARAIATLAAGLSLSPGLGFAATDDDSSAPAATVSAGGRGAGLGAALRSEASPYRGGGTRSDLVPVYVYEGKRVFLETYRAGVKLIDTPDARLDAFVGYRFEGHPYDRIPASLAGMASRNAGLDIGFTYQRRNPWGTLFGEVLHDVASGSNGSEVRVGYQYDWAHGNLQLQPRIAFAARDANLNNYYYGVRAAEATAARPAYEPGAGVNAELGLSAVYRLSERWRLFGGVSARRWSASVRASPIVQDRTQLAGQLGLAYDFSPKHDAWPDGRELIVKVLHGKSTDCDVARVMLLKCTSTTTVDSTRITAIEVGRPFIERLNGWPLDFVGYVGVLHHEERGLQDNSWQLNAYMKAYYYGLPSRLTRASNGPNFARPKSMRALSRRMRLTRTNGADEAGSGSALLHCGILSMAFCVSTRESISMLLMTVVACSREKSSGVTDTLASRKSPAVPTAMPLTVTCGHGNAAKRMLFIDTGSLSRSEAAFSMRGMRELSDMKNGTTTATASSAASEISRGLSHFMTGSDGVVR
ncbi:MAG: MipA/OmpV family protein [Gammaproteobacteria bacterium]|nr:MipA/OmpV family protein [Gammaproteobacteria bacterium]